MESEEDIRADDSKEGEGMDLQIAKEAAQQVSTTEGSHEEAGEIADKGNDFTQEQNIPEALEKQEETQKITVDERSSVAEPLVENAYDTQNRTTRDFEVVKEMELVKKVDPSGLGEVDDNIKINGKMGESDKDTKDSEKKQDCVGGDNLKEEQQNENESSKNLGENDESKHLNGTGEESEKQTKENNLQDLPSDADQDAGLKEETTPSADSDPHDREDASRTDSTQDLDQRSVKFASTEEHASANLESQGMELQEVTVGAGDLPLHPVDDSLRPPTGQTIMDRPISTTSFVYSSKDFPTPDYEQFIRPTPSVAESDGLRSDSKASRTMKSATSRGDGAKSVTFADDVKSPDGEKTLDEQQSTDDTGTQQEELFPTAVSEEKIEEATKKLKSVSSDSMGSEDSLLKEVFGLQRVKILSGTDLLNKRANEHYERGCELTNSKNYFAAIIAFDKAINLSPSEVRFYLMRGEAYLQVTDFQSAIQNFKKACVLRPTSDIYYSKLAFVYYLQGQSLFDQCLFTEALESFSRAAEMRPEIIGYHTRSIACLAALERHGECLALVNKRLELEHSNPDLYIMRARLHLLFRNTSLSYYDLKDALALDPDQQEAQRLLKGLEKKAKENRDFAVRLQLQGKFKEAMQKITLAIEMNPSVAEFHLLRGAVHRRLHDFNAAIDDFLLALDKTDHDESDNVYMDAQRQLLLTYNDFAVDCFLGNHFDEAILLLNKAIKGEKREKGLYVNRGDCFFRLSELHFALADYHQALELDPQDALVRGRIAAIHSEFGSIDYEEHSYQDAEARFTVAIQHNPQHSQYYLSRAKVRFMLELMFQNHSGARQDILISLHLNPSNDAIHSLLARLFPGKTVADVLRSKAAKEAKHVLEHAVVTASPVKLPSISRSPGAGLLQSLDAFTASSKVADDQGTSPFVLFMNEDDFNKVLARRKKKIGQEVKSSLQDRKSLKRDGPRLFPQGPPRDYVFKGGHWKNMDTQPPPGWRQFGLGITMKDA
ncbi:Tetratricopeptide repeat protein 16 [Holothuria leucospilota]|uniref:Tetratricopeptide repeat protein 16 n=1 Tax=Holothuria leucospilota TaxID=206669 RepID=A0A9Q1C7G5_HOLLE|nr:Tetratricopeptide repeat protein 16 [Holothuria leucospilota]